jgi:hypothetical protein
MTFKRNNQGDGHIHGIVHDNVTIFGTNVYLVMLSNSTKKSISNFKSEFILYYLSVKNIYILQKKKI